VLVLFGFLGGICGNSDPITSRKIVLSSVVETLFVEIEMDSVNHEERDDIERIAALNTVFDDLITDASDLVKDLFWGVKNYLFFGLVTFLFGVQEILYNIEVMQERLYVPLLIGGIMLFAGSVQILNYFRLRSKYSRLFEAQSKLKKS
jgi:hypothetical protein